MTVTRAEMMSAYARLADYGAIPEKVPDRQPDFEWSLDKLSAIHDRDVGVIRTYLHEHGFLSLQHDVQTDLGRYAHQLGSAADDLRSRQLGGSSTGRSGAMGLDPQDVHAKLADGDYHAPTGATLPQVAREMAKLADERGGTVEGWLNGVRLIAQPGSGPDFVESQYAPGLRNRGR